MSSGWKMGKQSAERPHSEISLNDTKELSRSAAPPKDPDAFATLEKRSQTHKTTYYVTPLKWHLEKASLQGWTPHSSGQQGGLGEVTME